MRTNIKIFVYYLCFNLHNLLCSMLAYFLPPEGIPYHLGDRLLQFTIFESLVSTAVLVFKAYSNLSDIRCRCGQRQIPRGFRLGIQYQVQLPARILSSRRKSGDRFAHCTQGNKPINGFCAGEGQGSISVPITIPRLERPERYPLPLWVEVHTARQQRHASRTSTVILTHTHWVFSVAGGSEYRLGLNSHITAYPQGFLCRRRQRIPLRSEQAYSCPGHRETTSVITRFASVMVCIFMDMQDFLFLNNSATSRPSKCIHSK